MANPERAERQKLPSPAELKEPLRPADTGRISGEARVTSARTIRERSLPSTSAVVEAGQAALETQSPTSQALRQSQIAQFPVRFRQTCLLTVILVSLFYILDLLYPWPPEVVLTKRQFFGVRALWVAGCLLLMATSYYKETNPQLQLLRDYTLVGVCSACLGVLCAHTGRMASPYYGGLMLVAIARFTLLPGSPWRMFAGTAYLIATWAGVTCLWPAPYPIPGFFGWKGIATMWFTVGVCTIGLIGAFLTDRLAQSLETAKMMGRYRLVRRLGSGGMGDVHLAFHASLRRPCAVKILKEELCDPIATARFEREAEAASRLRHPNTIAVFDFGRTDTGRPYYVMEYLEGSDLGQLVRECGPLDPARAVFLLEQVAGSLGEAHGQGMIHRDVKPGNLFVTAMGGHGDFVKVLDFGLVKGADLGPELTRNDAFMGTPRYMAPEALSGQKIDVRVDVYALGAVAYFMLCGEPPFASGDAYLDIYRQINDPPPPLETRRDPGLPKPSPELVALVMRCLEKDREQRYASANEILAALIKTPEHGQWQPPQQKTTPPQPPAEPRSLASRLREATSPSRPATSSGSRPSVPSSPTLPPSPSSPSGPSSPSSLSGPSGTSASSSPSVPPGAGDKTAVSADALRSERPDPSRTEPA